ncbi:hypothetical protein ACFOGI_11350 [Virgibacillus xinjiangensis]|uniref:Tubby C-terminal domain-containing protein n=1 Tax=Virgibacillus xinjiangensis TaxID=393090 RepID=A0ABV7CX96_9BACI
MGRLIVLFIFGFIGLSLRYIFLGEFEGSQLLLLLMLPAGSVILLFIMKWQYNKDRDFLPVQGENHLSTRLGDRVSTTTKQLYKGETSIGTYHRVYNSWWKRVIADVLDNPGQWYLNLSFSLANNDQVMFQQKGENKIRGNKYWVVYHNEQRAGTIQTDYSLKNSAKLKESLFLEVGKNTYQFKSSGMNAKTEINRDDRTVATGDRTMNSVYQLIMHSDDEPTPELLFMAFILFNYEFSQ